MKIFKFHLKKTLMTPNFFFLIALVIASLLYMYVSSKSTQTTQVCYKNNSGQEFKLEDYDTGNLHFIKGDQCDTSISISQTREGEFDVKVKGNVSENSVRSILQQINMNKYLKSEYKPLKINYYEDGTNKNSDFLNLLTFVVYVVVLLIGSQIYQSITSERVNKINTMLDFKFSVTKLMWMKIFANIISVAIAVTIFVVGEKILQYYGVNIIFEINDINFKLVSVYLTYIIYMLLYLTTFAYVASFVKSEDQIQSYSFIPIFITITAFGIGFLFNIVTDGATRLLLQYFPYTSPFVLPKISNETEIILVSLVSSIISVIFMIVLSIATKKNFRKEV